MPTIFRDIVTIGPLGAEVTFNDPTDLPAGAVMWGLDVMDGWDDTADMNTPSTELGGGSDGEVAADFFSYKARHMLLSGYVMGATRLDAAALRDVIARDALPRNVDLLLTRQEAVPKWMTVRVAGKREVQMVGPQAFRWIQPVMSEDPFKYSTTSQTEMAGVAGVSSGGRVYPRTYPLTYTTIASGESNSAVVNNLGTAPTSPLVTLFGPLDSGGWRLSNETTNKSIRFNIGLGPTDIMVIDFKQQIALLNGFPVTATIVGDFWKVEPGVNVIKLFADFDPGSGFSITINSAWEN